MSLNPELSKSLGRALLASIFVIPAVKSAFEFNGYVSAIESKNIPFAQVVAVVVLALKFFGGLSIVFNKHDSNVVLALILFTLAATILYHNAFKDPSQFNHMMKNLSIIGGLILLYHVDSCNIRATIFKLR